MSYEQWARTRCLLRVRRFARPVSFVCSWLAARPLKNKGRRIQLVRQPEDCKPWCSAEMTVTARYFRYLVVASCLGSTGRAGVVLHVLDVGGHRRSGPPSAAGTCWTAAAMNVPTSPTIRKAILIVRFMGWSPITTLGFSPDCFSRGAAL